MRRAAYSTVCRGQLILVVLNPGNKLLEVARRRSLARNDDVRVGGDKADRLEVFQHIVLLSLPGAVDDMRSPVADDRSIAIGLFARDLADCNASGSTANIFDDDRLAKRGPH